MYADRETHVLLQTPPDFRFSATRAYLTRSANECLFQVEDGKLYTLLKPGDEEAEPVLLEISSADDRELCVRFVDNPPDSSALRLEAAQYVREWFDLGRDLSPFYQLAQNEPLLRDVAQKYVGLRLVGVPDLFEALCWAILGQQINLGFAYTLKRRLVETFGTHRDWEGRRFWLFPPPERLAVVSVEELRDLQITTRKAEYLIGIAQEIADGRLSKSRLLQLGELSDLERELVKLRGIGPWTAHYVIMRCLRHPDAFPLADAGLHNAIKHVQNLPQKPSLDEVLRISERFGSWKAYATFYLWMTLLP
ncbi:hypothetical protein EL26_09235 [Tumebacillus flagellatus]|uniref:DNA-3-methyladenine glycosylase II n=1 Tax=Tumebacillus flagellatus TaxID=1157490 RepID=A0A074LSW8_9BACL|nr:hypothetical protein EL26_09235 [Tumebacillus flagellatus]